MKDKKGFLFVEKTFINESTIKYLLKLESFGGTASRAPWDKGKQLVYEIPKEVLDNKLVEKADDGSSDSYIARKISKRGYDVLKQYKKRINN